VLVEDGGVRGAPWLLLLLLPLLGSLVALVGPVRRPMHQVLPRRHQLRFPRKTIHHSFLASSDNHSRIVLPPHDRLVCYRTFGALRASFYLFIYLFKHRRQRAEVTYMPVESVQ